MRFARHLEPLDEEASFAVHDVFVPRAIRRDADVIPPMAAVVSEYIERRPTLLTSDIVYAHWLWPAGAAALQLRSRFGWPVVAIARGSEMHDWQPVHRHCRGYVQRVIRESDRVLANCAAFRDECQRLVRGLGRPIDVVYNGCNPEQFAPAADKAAVRRTLGIDAGSKVMLFCGSVSERKGIRTLVRSWETFSAYRPEWQLIVVGRLVDRQLVRSLAATRAVALAGPVEHRRVATYMQAADAYVQPSINEGLANATMEAMATGLPVIATDTGGQGELVRNGQNGLLVPVEDHVALASAFEFLSRNTQQAQEFGVQARKTIITRFSQEQQVAALAVLLRNTHRAHARGRSRRLQHR
jgi:glycosyltransferase involved in cell wall biosynthesis